MKSKSKFEAEFCDHYGAEVAQSLFAAVLLIAAVAGLFFCSGCGGPAFEENLFADNATDSGNNEDVGLPPPPPGLLDAGLETSDSNFDSNHDTCPQHDDGFGDVFYSCEPDAGAYSLDLAFNACVAAGGIRTTTPTQTITCTNEDWSVCRDKSSYVQWTKPDGGCESWAWAGDLVGQTFTNCGCPTGPSHSRWY